MHYKVASRLVRYFPELKPIPWRLRPIAAGNLLQWPEAAARLLQPGGHPSWPRGLAAVHADLFRRGEGGRGSLAAKAGNALRRLEARNEQRLSMSAIQDYTSSLGMMLQQLGGLGFVPLGRGEIIITPRPADVKNVYVDLHLLDLADLNEAAWIFAAFPVLAKMVASDCMLTDAYVCRGDEDQDHVADAYATAIWLATRGMVHLPLLQSVATLLAFDTPSSPHVILGAQTLVQLHESGLPHDAILTLVQQASERIDQATLREMVTTHFPDRNLLRDARMTRGHIRRFGQWFFTDLEPFVGITQEGLREMLPWAILQQFLGRNATHNGGDS